MDITQKRLKGSHKFFNGLAISYMNDYGKGRVFNVRPPRQALRDTDFCTINGYNGYKDEWYDGAAPTSDLAVIVTEEELRHNSYYSFDRWKTQGNMWPPMHSVQKTCYQNPYVAKWYQDGVKVIKSFEVPTFPFVDTVENDIYEFHNIQTGDANWLLLANKRQHILELPELPGLPIPGFHHKPSSL